MKKKEAVIVTDLGFGDAGKGTIVDWLARTRGSHTVVRFNGGAQAGHNVVTPDGRHHTFSQFGSATFVPGVRTHLSRFMLLSPLAMLAEESMLRNKGVTDAFERTTISAEALVITPFQRAANRIRELSRGDGRHGSCGMGIGETMADLRDMPDLAVRAGDLIGDARAFERKLKNVQMYKVVQMQNERARCRELGVGKEDVACLEDIGMTERYLGALLPFLRQASIVEDAYLGRLLAEPGSVLFEGAQGVLLDEVRGFHPYTTWSNCTFGNALLLLAENRYDGELTRLGVVRAYQTRHGPGPFVTENVELGKAVPDMHNRMDDWQRNFRVGWFDAVATRYAIAACGGADALAVTCLDRLRAVDDWRTCDAYVLTHDDVGDERLFVVGTSGGRTVAPDIRLGPPRDLAHQQALTDALARARPWTRSTTTDVELTDFDAKVEAHLAKIAWTTGVPVKVASFGPTADDKQLL